MDQNKMVSVGNLLSSIASTLGQNQGNLDQLDAGGSHGTRMAQAFDAAAQAAQRTGTQDAGEQLSAAAQAMRQQGKGRAAGFYANGLEQAASQFQGKNGIAASDLLPLLQSLAGGAQQGNPAKSGQGTMLDALLPAVSALTGAQQQGADPNQAAIQAMSSAANGAMGTITRTRGGGQGGSSSIDPGAASAMGVLGGIFQALLPGLMSMASQKFLGGSNAPQSQFPASQASTNDPMGGFGGLGGLLGGLLGGSGAQDSVSGNVGMGDQTGGLDGLLGGLLGGSQGSADTPISHRRIAKDEGPGSGNDTSA